MTTSRRNTIMLWMAYTEFFYPGCELQPGYFYLSIPELYYIPEDGACIGAAGVDAYIPTINLARTGANITHLRKAAGLSVHDLQMAFGFNSPQAIYKWQNGTALPTVDNLIALAALLHVRMDDIIITDHSVA